jgi:hypothetical protein
MAPSARSWPANGAIALLAEPPARLARPEAGLVRQCGPARAKAAAKRKLPGQTTERIGAFVDAVLAIAMTLLVIDIPREQAAQA